MKVLLTNHHLAMRAGSELYTQELATALARRGHRVALFTFLPGRLAAEMRGAGLPVFTPEHARAIEEFGPDVVHVHHSPCLYFLAGLRLDDAAAIFSSLGPATPLESAPVVWAGVSLGVAVSEEVRDALSSTPFARSVPVRIVRNWFDDAGLAPPSRRRARTIRRVVVVTNHLDPAIATMLDEITARRPGFEWTHWGAPRRSVRIEPARLASFDAVVTIGRTALLAGALGLPCLIHDVHGCDGWLDAYRFDEIAAKNFSGRAFASKPSRAELEDLLFARAGAVDVAATARRCWESFSLSRRCEEFEAIHQAAVSSSVRLGDAARASYGRLGEVLRESLYTARASGYHTGRAEATASRTDTGVLEQANRRIHELERSLREAISLGTAAAQRLAWIQAQIDERKAAGPAPTHIDGAGVIAPPGAVTPPSSEMPP